MKISWLELKFVKNSEKKYTEAVHRGVKHLSKTKDIWQKSNYRR